MDTVCDFEIFQNRIEPVKSMDFDDHYWWNATITDPNLHLRSSSLRLPRSTTIDTASLSFGNVVRGNQNFWQRGFLENEHCPCPPSIVYIYIFIYLYIYIVWVCMVYLPTLGPWKEWTTHTHQKFSEQIVVADKPEITILFLVKNHEIYSDIVVSSPMKWLG